STDGRSSMSTATSGSPSLGQGTSSSSPPSTIRASSCGGGRPGKAGASTPIRTTRPANIASFARAQSFCPSRCTNADTSAAAPPSTSRRATLTPVVVSAELLDAREHPASAGGRLDEVPDLVERLGLAAGFLADHAGEAHAGDVLDGGGLDAEQLRVQRDDVGPVGRALALVDLELQFRIHLGSRELAQVAQVGSVVRRLQPDELHLRGAHERIRIE